MKRNIKLLIFGIACLSLGVLSHAHTISYGFENAGPGSVTIWMGSYHTLFEANQDGQPNEGYLEIQGINGNSFPLTALDFDLATGTKPSGLVYDYIDPGWSEASNTLWQGVTFTAVQAGDYSFYFNPSASLGGNPATSVVFAPWNTAVQTGTFTLTPDIVQAPDAGSSIALLAFGLTGILGLRRKVSR